MLAASAWSRHDDIIQGPDMIPRLCIHSLFNRPPRLKPVPPLLVPAFTCKQQQQQRQQPSQDQSLLSAQLTSSTNQQCKSAVHLSSRP
jgi:hypothetical protein